MNWKDRKKKIICILAIVFSIIYMVWRTFYTLPFKHGVIAIIAGICLLIAELIGIISGTEQLSVPKKKKLPQKVNLPLDKYPDVDVFIATHNESEELLYKTVNGCQNMDYPDKNKVHIYICDDAERPEMEALAKKMNIRYLGVKDKKLAKAGNLNYALENTSSPLVATFDADMIPLSSFLMDTVPYFFNEEFEFDNVGFVQTPQSFYNADLFQYNLYAEEQVPNEQDFFFKEINIIRNNTNTPIYAGSNTLISRKALDDVEGIATGLITEDFATGIRIQKKGYKTYATSKIEANGLAPNDLKSLIKQRERWARGCIQSLKKEHILLSRNLKLKQKWSYINSLLYWYNPLCRLMYILAPILFGLFDIFVLEYTFVEMLYMWVPYYVFYTAAMRYVSGNIRNSRLSNVYDTIMYPYLIIPIILETIGIKKKKFAVTKKDNSLVKKNTLKYAIPHIIAAVFSVLALIRCIVIAINTSSPYYMVVIFWLIYNLYGICMSIFFIIGRKIFRNVERFNVEIDVEIRAKYGTFKGKTLDISDNGLSVKFDFPEYIDEDEIVEIICESGRYKASLNASVVYFTNEGNGFKYAFVIENIDDANKREYLNIIYDREPTLPKVIEVSSSIFGELSSNIHSRIKKYAPNSRRLARINVYKKFNTTSGKEIMVYNFIYEHFLVGYIWSSKIDKNIEIIFDEVLVLKGEREYEKISHPDTKRVTILYKVTNLEEIITNEKLKLLLNEWIDSQKEYDKQMTIKRRLREKSNEDEFDEIEYVWGGDYNE